MLQDCYVALLIVSDLDECKVFNHNPCPSTCDNTFGSYNCLCEKGYLYNKEERECQRKLILSIMTFDIVDAIH